MALRSIIITIIDSVVDGTITIHIQRTSQRIALCINHAPTNNRRISGNNNIGIRNCVFNHWGGIHCNGNGIATNTPVTICRF